MLAYNTSNSFQVRMPTGNLNSTLLKVLVQVKDQYDCITEMTLSPIFVIPDMNNIISLITTTESSMINSDDNIIISANPLIVSLYGGNQNDICQVLTSAGQVLNILAQQNLHSAIKSMFFSLN
jgi:hypothetical protein